MRAKDIVKTGAKLWKSRVVVRNPQYNGYLEVQVWAPNANVARQLLKTQYQVQDWQVGSVQEVR